MELKSTQNIEQDAPVVIDVQNVKKKFTIYYDRGATLKERILFKNRRRHEERWVLKGISFQVRKGEAIGLIGENGCGKSTTLKMLTKILYPDAGSIKMTGRVSSLIELGAGFHPDMSGRENIYTNASIFGLKKEEIDRRLQQIIDFSELGEFIDNPVRTYSSGMYMRLAFAVAINVDADILLIDEILAVGDAAFQSKCFNKLREIKRRGTTIVIVSHSLGQIEQICERSIWIEGGFIREQGKPKDVHPKYLRYMSEKTGTLSQNESQETEEEKTEEEKTPETNTSDNTAESKTVTESASGDFDLSETDKRWGSKEVSFESIILMDETGKDNDSFESGRPFKIYMNYTVNTPINDEMIVGIAIHRNDGIACYGTNTFIEHVDVIPKDMHGSICFDIKYNNLIEGEYSLDVAIQKPDGFAYDFYQECRKFHVFSEIKDVGIMRLEHVWEIK